MNLDALVLPLSVENKAFNAALGAAVAGVGALVGAMGLAIKSTFDWANSLDEIQDVMGVTNTQAAAFSFLARKSGTDVNVLTKANTILAKGLVKVDGTLDTTGKALEDWGVSIKDGNGNMKNQAALLDDIGKKYATLGTQTEKVNFLTEVYGRSGAELVDFFDTLANEGSIDLVAEKVENLGLAIDPNRYEQFNRNLEELKMIGLGLAVSFTEKVMPLLENFLEWIGDFAGSQEWADFKAGFNDFTSRMAEAIGNGDWAEVKSILFEKLGQFDDWIAEQFDAMDWSGAGSSFGTALDKIMNQGVGQVDVPNSLQSLFDGINKFFLSAVGADKFGGWKNYFFVWGEQIKAGFGATMTNWKISASNFFVFAENDLLQNWNEHIMRFFLTATAMVGGPIASFFSVFTAKWMTGVINWGVSVYNKVVEWVNKILSAFNRVTGLNLNLPAVSTGGGGTSGGRAGRASGGPVIAGQTYNVHAREIYSDGAFTAPANGRVDPIQQGGGMTIDYDRLAEAIGLQVGIQIAKAL